MLSLYLSKTNLNNNIQYDVNVSYVTKVDIVGEYLQYTFISLLLHSLPGVQGNICSTIMFILYMIKTTLDATCQKPLKFVPSCGFMHT